MPWKVSDVLDERTRFVLEYNSGLWTMAEVGRIRALRAAEKLGIRADD